MATKKIKINFKMPTPTAAERLHALQQKNRKAAGLPDPSEYKKKLDSMKKENYEEDDGPLSQEQLDEISSQLKASYVSGAKKQIKQSLPFTKKTDEYRDIAKNFIAKRQKGIAKANEEVELLDEMPESSMKTRDVHSHLKKAGWELARSKGGHDVYKHPKAKHSIPVPRHNQLKAPLIRGIMKASKVEEQLEKKGRFVSGPVKQPYKSDTIVTAIKESVTVGRMVGRGNIYQYDRNPGPRDGSELEHVPFHAKTEKQKKLQNALNDLGKKMKETHPKLREAKDSQEYDYEGDMAKSDLRSIIHNAQTLHDMLDDNTNLAEWCQSKITLAEDYISTVTNYMRSEMNEEIELDEMVVVKTNKPIGTRVADIGPGGKEYNVKTNKAWDDSKKKQPQGADFAAQRRKERLAKSGRMDEKENLPGLWANIHAKRKRGEPPAKPGDKDYPKDLETVRSADKESVKESVAPFNKPYNKDSGTTTDKSGAKHTPMSKARHLARQALSKTASKKADTKQQARNAFDGMFGGGNPADKLGIMKKESASEPTEGEMKGKQGYSRKAQIVMNAAKGKKSDSPDKFQKDPELSSEIHKT